LLVTRDELRHRIWGSDTFVDFDQGLNRAVNKLRDALGDTAETPRFIETLPRRGYRFIAPVERPPEIDANLPARLTPKPRQLPYALPGGLPLVYGALGSAVLLALALLVVRRPQIRSANIVLPLTSLPGAAGAPTLSPNGNQVAFAWNGWEGNNFDIY